jgi:hypothetical protein
MTVEVKRLVAGPGPAHEPEATVVGRVTEVGGVVKIDADDATERFLRNYTTRGGHTFDDGHAWLVELPESLHGSRLWAESV